MTSNRLHYFSIKNMKKYFETFVCFYYVIKMKCNFLNCLLSFSCLEKLFKLYLQQFVSNPISPRHFYYKTPVITFSFWMAPLYRKAIHFYDCKRMEQILQCIISKNEFQSESTVFSRWQIKHLKKYFLTFPAFF